MATSGEDKHAMKMARSIFSKRGIDISQTDFRVANGVCYLRGTIRYLAGGHNTTLDKEMSEVLKALRQKEGIRDVVCDYTIR
jgi:hypothetical protein